MLLFIILLHLLQGKLIHLNTTNTYFWQFVSTVKSSSTDQTYQAAMIYSHMMSPHYLLCSQRPARRSGCCQLKFRDRRYLISMGMRTQPEEKWTTTSLGKALVFLETFVQIKND